MITLSFELREAEIENNNTFEENKNRNKLSYQVNYPENNNTFEENRNKLRYMVNYPEGIYGIKRFEERNLNKKISYFYRNIERGLKIKIGNNENNENNENENNENENNGIINKEKIKTDLIKITDNNLNSIIKILNIFYQDLLNFCQDNIIYINIFTPYKIIKHNENINRLGDFLIKTKRTDDIINITKVNDEIITTRTYRLEFNLNTNNGKKMYFIENILKITVEITYKLNNNNQNLEENLKFLIKINFVWKDEYIKYFLQFFMYTVSKNEYISSHITNPEIIIFLQLISYIIFKITPDENKIEEINKILAIIPYIQDDNSFNKYFEEIKDRELIRFSPKIPLVSKNKSKENEERQTKTSSRIKNMNSFLQQREPNHEKTFEKNSISYK